MQFSVLLFATQLACVVEFCPTAMVAKSKTIAAFFM